MAGNQWGQIPREEVNRQMGKEEGQGTPGKETQKGEQKRWDVPGERWRGWPHTDNSGVPLSMPMLPASKKAYVSK